jgi:hypothetical protein
MYINIAPPAAGLVAGGVLADTGSDGMRFGGVVLIALALLGTGLLAVRSARLRRGSARGGSHLAEGGGPR